MMHIHVIIPVTLQFCLRTPFLLQYLTLLHPQSTAASDVANDDNVSSIDDDCHVCTLGMT